MQGFSLPRCSCPRQCRPPSVVLDGDEIYKPKRCWEEMYDAINEAKHIIYITGWSLFTQISLVRDLSRPHPRRGEILGELLKRKAEVDGVRVVLLLWNDIIATSLFKNAGLMDTHCKETQKYFKDTKVHCVLCTRDNVFYTHHQKIVVVDAKFSNGENSDKRRIVSFIGGIDLCGGRYNTQFHSLFRTLATDNSKDFHQPSITDSAIEKGGPREPWHDVHCKLEGRIAWDVCSTFVERFKKQVIDQSKLLSEEDFKHFIVAPSQVIGPDEKDAWNVQLFRSVDDSATVGFSESAEDAFKVGLVNEEDKTIDRSIQDAYIQAIRQAKNFIYIENQYFIGSDFDWNVDEKKEHSDAVNLIPKELSLKIVSKIKARKRFVVCVVIPMWLEGVPESGAVQKILYLQRRTIEMMYKDIVQALKEEGLKEDP
ncbi:Hydrolyzes glycerol-phospholipids at the terminal phosphodiesteric bond [Stylosanthes scabra]|uniref:phospholipase D n=1 Tax=Stylosanthes scabra TaxID=79078 RepID=A0ABU6XP33_9FABA|nr:Hydrolyzes glycerol-phospholipids at the terminal phosphodiesteric bond [Stylosanthes scabra]